MAARQGTATEVRARLRAWFWPVVGALVGVLAGAVLFTFGYANGSAYFGRDPGACAQCHSMNKQFDAWSAGPHHHVATCQDCHAPHDDPVAWVLDEADNGFWHSLKFTFGAYPQNIRIRDKNREVVEEACLYCHRSFVDRVELGRPHDQGVSCLRCHNEVGHER